MGHALPVTPLLLATVLGCSPEPAACDADAPCAVADGDYLAFAPPDAAGPVPVVALVHGAGGSAAGMASEARIAQAADAGVLLVVPEGTNGGWDVVDWPGSTIDRDEVAFLSAVLDDAVVRFDGDPDRTAIAGFSIGASMALEAGCAAPEKWTAWVPTSGTFWEPQPAECGAPLRPVRHIHGDADATWPRAGRSFSAAAVQGDVDDSLALWRELHGCDAEQVETFTVGDRTCTRWTACASGLPVEDCRHDGGHSAPEDWVTDIAEWAEASW